VADEKPKTRRAWVTPEGGEPVEVEIQDPHPAPEAVAVIAWRKKANAWEDPRKIVSVTFEPPQKG
jgi:hypothetical protein